MSHIATRRNVEPDESYLGWIASAVTSAIAALSSAVAYLFRSQVKLYETRITQLEAITQRQDELIDKCEHEHAETKVELATIKERLRVLEGN